MEEEKSEFEASSYPEGWKKCLELLTEVPEDQREAYLKGYLQTVLNF